MKNNVLKLTKKKVVASILAVLAIVGTTTSVLRKDDIAEVLGLVPEKSVATYYNTITEYQQARWKEIQASIFGSGVATSVTDTNLLNRGIISGNSYFNWTSTSASAWSGGSSAVGSSGTETKTYSTVIDNGTTATRSVTYTVFNVYNAEQLYYVMNTYKDSGSNIKVNIMSDINLNGNTKVWTAVNLTGVGTYFYIEGNGHGIYNLNTNKGFVETIDKYFIVKNLTFYSVKIVAGSGNVGLMGHAGSTKGLLYENVRVKGAFVQNTSELTGVLVAHVNTSNAFIKNCSTEDCYVYSSGQHTGGLTTIFDGTSTNCGVRYNTPMPTNPEATFGFDNPDLGQNNSGYPAMIQDTYSINSEIFATAGHSGCFVSCSDGALIMRNCYTNNTIYGEVSVGGLSGLFSGGAWAFSMYDDTGVKSVTNYCENCYSSGIVEGKSGIGGFIGWSNAGVYKNCYSTASVGMDFSGENLGGFVGYQQTPVNSMTISGCGSGLHSAYINCYSAGEVGDISTDCNNTTAVNKKIGGFIGGQQNAGDTSAYNCYYDMQTSAMREVAVGSNASNCQVSGINGAYTQASDIKNVKGLAKSTSSKSINMNDDSAWIYKTGYYPQLKAFANSSSQQVKNYSQASTSTVFLDHYDEVLDASGNVVNSTDAKVYDTVRDITSAFELTSTGNSETGGNSVVWGVDTEKNTSKGYIQTFVIKNGATVVKSVPVLQIAQASNIYKCYTFAPGKSWIKVNVGSGSNAGINRIRLLPTAYLNGGEYTEVHVVNDATGNSVIDNEVTKNNVTTTNTKYNHTSDTLFAITSAANLGDKAVIYPGQVTSKNASTANLFAQWNTFPANTSAVSTMYSQSLIGNSNPNGKTKVDIYKLGIQYTAENTGISADDSTIKVPKIDYSSATKLTSVNMNKWNGNTYFVNSDAGWYELRYYWRLNDGRFVYDTKIVKIESKDQAISVKDNILNSKSYLDSNTLNVSNDIAQNTTNRASTDVRVTTESTRNVVTTEEANNKVVKTKTIHNFGSEQAVIALGGDDNHRLEALSLKISTDGENWTSIPVTLTNGYTKQYSYLYQKTKVVQDAETKVCSITKVGTPIKVTFKTSYIVDGNNSYLTVQYTDADDTIINNSDIEVEATYITIADFTAKKVWDDNNSSKRPNSIKLTFTDSNNVKYTKTVTAADGWEYTLEDAPTVDLDSNAITYTVDESEVNSGELKYYTKNINNLTVTNTMITYDIKTKVNGTGGTISGMNDTIYETVEYTDTNTKDIVLTADAGYKIKSIKVTYGDGTTENIAVGSGTVKTKTLAKFTNISKDITVTAEFEKIPAVVNVKYVDLKDNSNIATATLNGYVLEPYEAETKTFTGYQLVNTPANKTGNYTEAATEVVFGYKKISAGITVNYVDKFQPTNVLDTYQITGLEGDAYTTSSKTFTGYRYLNEVTGTTAGNLQVAAQTITYYYAKESTVKVKYIDANTNLPVSEETSNVYYETNTYSTTAKTISGYTCTSNSGNVTGTVGRADITVTYYYKKNSSVTVNYIDKFLNTNVLNTYTIDGLEGDAYTTSSKTFSGYRYLNETDGDLNGNIPRNPSTVTYYYAKESTVTVKYIDANTNQPISAETSTVYIETNNYATAPKAVTGYTCTSNSGNVTGTVARDNITVTYYYKKDSYVTVNYVDKFQPSNVLDTYTITGLEADPYTTSSKTFNGYRYLNEVVGDANGNIQRNPSTVTYYYAKESQVTVKYIDENYNTILSPMTTNTYIETDTYTTTPKVIDGYTCTSNSGNVSGTIGRSSITVTYYYKKISKVTIIHKDKYDDSVILKTQVIDGLEKDSYTVSSEDFTGYVYEKGAKETITRELEANPTTVVFNYVKLANVTTKYVDYYTGEEISEREVQSYRENDIYTTTQKDITGYSFREVTENHSGVMGRENIEVVYYYNKNTSVIIKYVDKYDTSIVLKSITKPGVEGMAYTSDTATFEGYKFADEIDGEPSGLMGAEPKTITYYYILQTYVMTDYIDENTGVPVASEKINVYGQKDTYTTVKENIDGYTFTRDSGNTTGTVERSIINVTYYYKKNTSVTVKYVDNYDRNNVLKTIKIDGLQGDRYDTEILDFDGYEYGNVSTGNLSGTMPRDPITITYYYIKKSNLIVEHIDANTNEKIVENDVISYKEKEEYTAVPKHLPGYVLVEEPEEKTGIMGREDVTKTFKYKKISGGIVVNYVDQISGELLSQVVITGNENDTSVLKTKSFMYYVLESKPDVTDVTLTVEAQEYVFYYRRNIKMEVVGKDADTHEELYRHEVPGIEGDPYETNAKVLEGYELVKTPENANGIYSRDNLEVIYEYRRYQGSVMVMYVDEDTNETIAVSDTFVGALDTEYTTYAKDIPGYTYSRVEGKVSGIYTTEPEMVTYYYTKNKGVLIIKYVDEEGSEVYTERFTEKVGTEYSVDIKEIEGYEIVEYPENATGVYTEGTTEIVVKVEKIKVAPAEKGTIIIKFVDSNGNVILERVVKTGDIGEIFKYTAPAIDGYRPVVNGQIKAVFKDGELVFDVIYEKIPEVVVGPEVTDKPEQTPEVVETPAPETGDINVMLFVLATIGFAVVSKKELEKLLDK